jgi:hypothetical protein
MACSSLFSAGLSGALAVSSLALSANRLARLIKNLVDKISAGSQAHARAVRVRIFVIDDLAKDRELILAQNIGS